ncbi:MAG: DUF1513 domain-containing protein [Endozoicomonas sp.]
MITRRQLFKAGLAAGAALLGGCSFSSSPTLSKPLVSAARNNQGQHSIRIFSADRLQEYSVDIPFRAHDVAQRPGTSEIVVFDRRPGRFLYRLDWRSAASVEVLNCDSNRHLYGHGVFSPDGRWLYTTENNLDNLSGVIGIYDAEKGYQRVGEWSLDGHGPHEIQLMPDGQTLVVALGGMKTHPDTGREVLNLETMQSALVYIDRLTGLEVERQEFVDPQLSIRHLAVSSDGLVAVGMQYQGEPGSMLPLAAFHRRGEPLDAVKADDEQWLLFSDYVASVCLLPEAGSMAITSPRGNRIGLVDLHDGSLKTLLHDRDCAGLAAVNGNELAVSNGLGDIRLLKCHNGSASELGRVQYAGIQWDNHMLAV